MVRKTKGKRNIEGGDRGSSDQMPSRVKKKTLHLLLKRRNKKSVVKFIAEMDISQTAATATVSCGDLLYIDFHLQVACGEVEYHYGHDGHKLVYRVVISRNAGRRQAGQAGQAGRQESAYPRPMRRRLREIVVTRPLSVCRWR